MHTATAQSHAKLHSHQHLGSHTPAAAKSAAKPKLYNPRHPEHTLLYRTVAEHFETWFELASAGQLDGQGDNHTPPRYVEQAFRKYLECGIFAHGFARARCEDCGHDFFVAFSCKGRGVCPPCNTRRMAETAAHLADHVLPRLPVLQWVLSVPKRLRYFLQRDGAALNTALRIFLQVVQQSLHEHCPGAEQVDKAALRIGAVVFIHRFGSSLNTHVHYRTGLERLLRYCARPPFSMERLRKEGCALVYRCAKQHSEPVGGKQSDLALTPMDLIDRIAALVPPPRTHRHRYYGVLAPNSPLREQITAMAQVLPAPLQAQAHDPTSPESGAATGAVGIGGAAKQPVTQPPKHSPAHYLWAALIARIYEVFPLICPIRAGQMRIIAFITDGAEVRNILEHIGANSQAPRITPARGPPLWDECDAPLDEGVQALTDWDLAAQPAPDYQVDQRVSW